MKNSFLERTIDNWLTNVNEKGYQLAFTQMLIADGYTILKSSTHNSYEQGKDIIARHKNGDLHCFQLKGGSITKNVWHKISDEVTELVEYSVDLPGIAQGEKHTSYLVTNGTITDTAVGLIANLNRNNWKMNPLQIWQKGDLQTRFNKLSQYFTPYDPQDIHQFFELYLIDPTSLPDRNIYHEFFLNLAGVYDKGVKKTEWHRRIDSIGLYAAYLISNYNNKGNYISSIQILMTAVIVMLLIIEKYELTGNQYLPTITTLLDEIDSLGSKTIADIQKEGGLENYTRSFFDGDFGGVRRHITYQTLFAAVTTNQLRKHPFKYGTEILDLFLWDQDTTLVSEESFLVYIFHYWLSLTAGYKYDESYGAIQVALGNLIQGQIKEETALPSPHVGINKILEFIHGMNYDLENDNPHNSSYYLYPIIMLLTIHNQRRFLAKGWKKISQINYYKFTPKELWENFLFLVNTGNEHSEFFPRPTSWKSLQKEAKSGELGQVPEVLKNLPYLIPLYLCVLPHRFTWSITYFLDQEIHAAKGIKSIYKNVGASKLTGSSSVKKG